MFPNIQMDTNYKIRRIKHMNRKYKKNIKMYKNGEIISVNCVHQKIIIISLENTKCIVINTLLFPTVNFTMHTILKKTLTCVIEL